MDEDDEDDDNDDDESDDDDDDDDDDDEATAAAVQEAQQRVAESPHDFPAHLELVRLLKQRAELDDVREAREQMAALFPLPEAVWLEWLGDEERLAESPEELQALQQLALRACTDYLVVPLWLRYIELTQKLHAPWTAEDAPEPRAPQAAAEAAGVPQVREALEKGLTAGGLHLSEGPKLWDAYERFELRLLAAATDEAARGQQAKVVRALYRRRLAVPLLDAEASWKRYEAWEAGPPAGAAAAAKDIKAAQLSSEAARGEARRRRSIELRVKAAAASSGSASPWAAEGGAWAAWEQYLQLESTAPGGRPQEGTAAWRADPWRSRCLYERLLVPSLAPSLAPSAGGGAVGPQDSDLCYDVAVWRRYLAFLHAHLPAAPLLLETSARAVRHCPSSPQLWQERLRALEEGGKTADEVQAEFERALSQPLRPTTEEGGGAEGGGDASGYMMLLHAYSHYQRRRLSGGPAPAPAEVVASVRAARDAVLGYQAAYLAEAEPDAGLIRLWAAVEARVLGSLPQARSTCTCTCTCIHTAHAPHTLCTCTAHTQHMPAPCLPQARVLFEPLLRRGEASLWLELASLEAPNAERERAVYRRGASEVHALVQARPLHAAWLSFEALHGSVQQQRQAELRCAERLADALAREPPPPPPVAAHGAEGAEGAEDAAAAAAASREREHRRTQARKAKRRETHVAVPGGDEAQLRQAEIASDPAEAEPPAKKQNRGPPKPGPPPAAPTEPKPAGPAATSATTTPAAAAPATTAATATAAARPKPSLLPRSLVPRALQTKAGRAKPAGKPTPGTKPVVRVKLPPPAAAPQPGAPEPKTNQQLRDLLLPK